MGDFVSRFDTKIRIHIKRSKDARILVNGLGTAWLKYIVCIYTRLNISM